MKPNDVLLQFFAIDTLINRCKSPAYAGDIMGDILKKFKEEIDTQNMERRRSSESENWRITESGSAFW
jgi:hypothetical protein